MKNTQRRWLTATFATIGAGALAIGGAVVPAAADDAPDAPVELQSSATKYDLAAAQSSESAESIKQLEQAGLVSVSDLGFFYYKDEIPEPSTLAGLDLELAPQGAPIPGTPAAGSRPGAPVTVYLDFDGEVLENTLWNEQPSGIESLNFAAATSVTNQAAVWAAVAEDYAPFNVNVTTTRPSDDLLYKTSIDDNTYGSHVIITDSYTDVLPEAAGSGGIAFLGGTGSEFLSGALVFTNGTEGSPKAVAEIATHESGHNFGLEHDGITGAETGEYYVPTEGVWGTIMGAAYYVPLSQWSVGDYAGATNPQDDLATITDRSAGGAAFLGARLPDGTPYEGNVCVESGDPENPQPGNVFYAVGVNGNCNPAGELLTLDFTFVDRADFIADTVGNTPAAATALTNEDDTFEAENVIVTSADVDVYAVTTAGGTLTASVSVADISPNLDAKLTLWDANGVVLEENDDPSARDSESVATGLNATVSVDNLVAGNYYLGVQGVGSGDPSTATPTNANGYSAYGSLGNYTLTGNAAAFDSEPLVILTPEDGSAVEGGEEIAVTGTATPNATVNLSVGGAVVDTITADDEGAWSGNVTVNQYGPTEIAATQQVGTIVIPGTVIVTVVAPAAPLAAPVITTPTNGATVDDSTPTISGTGVAGSTVTVTVRSAAGAEVVSLATVAADGTWTVAATAALANGAYTATAVQTLAEETSAPSAAVNFTVAAAVTGGNNDDDLATTGSDFDAAPFAVGAVMLLLVGGGILFYARRKSLV